MPTYTPTVNIGDERARVPLLTVHNPLVGTDSVEVREEIVALFADGEKKVASGRLLTEGFAEGGEVALRNPIDDSELGTTVTHTDIQVLGYSLARLMQLADDTEQGIDELSRYAATVNPGDERLRVSIMRMVNPLGGGSYVEAVEEKIMLFASGERVVETNRTLIEQYEEENEIPLRNPLTDEVIGTTTHAEIFTAFYSLARAVQLAADARNNRKPS